MEQLYPVLFEEYSLHEGSGGAGEHRGGFGVNYRIRLRRGEARVSMVMDHGRAGPPGAQGGGAGGINKVSDHPRRRRSTCRRISRRTRTSRSDAGDVIAVSTPGGGGFGPAERGRPRPRASATSRSATTAPTSRERAFGAARRHEPRPSHLRRRQRRRRCAEPVHRRLPRSTPQSGWCEGCLRTIDEIAAWGALDDAARREIWKRLPARRRPGRRARRDLRDDAMKRRLLVRSGVALRLPRVRAPARGLRRACRTRVSYRPIVFAALLKALRPQGPGRDRAEARLDLPPGALARPSRTASRSTRRSAIRSTRSRSRAWHGRRRRAGATPSRHRLRDGPAPRLARRRRRRGCRSASRRSRAQLAPRLDPASDDVKQRLRAATDARARARRLRRADARHRRQAVLGLRRPRHGRRLSSAASPGSPRRTGSAKARRAPA